MFTLRRAKETHHEGGGWFDARWHFSFDRYRDPEQMRLGALRVLNDDRIVAGGDWPMNRTRDIESLTYVVEGDFLTPTPSGRGRLILVDVPLEFRPVGVWAR